MGIEHCLEKLIKYGQVKGFFDARDTRYVRNRLLEVLQYPDYPEVPEEVSKEKARKSCFSLWLRGRRGTGVCAEALAV